MSRFLSGYMIKLVYNRPKVQRSAQYKKNANSIYCDLQSTCPRWRMGARRNAAGCLLASYSERLRQCQHFPSVCDSVSQTQAVLTESRPCLDQYATMTSPCTRLGNLKSSPVRGSSFSLQVPPEAD